MVPIDGNPLRTFCVFGWMSLLLIWKNVVLLGLLMIFRTRDKQINIPEDATAFGRQRRTGNQAQQPQPVDNWSTANRIARVLSNETEYVPYFLIFALTFCVSAPTSTTRQLVYGCIFVAARYIHNLGLILRSTYPRILGFFLSFLVLGAMTLDLTIYLTQQFRNTI